MGLFGGIDDVFVTTTGAFNFAWMFDTFQDHGGRGDSQKKMCRGGREDKNESGHHGCYLNGPHGNRVHMQGSHM